MRTLDLRSLVVAGAAGLLAVHGRPTDASAAEPATVKAARDLFMSAERDEDAGRWRDALDKLRRVSEVKSTAGVRYHIALCEEHLGRLAGALADYQAADAQAQADHADDVLRLVGDRLVDLGPRVPRLLIHVLPESPEVQVTLDGEAIPPAHLRASIAVDPGPHRIGAEAPGRTPASVAVTVRERSSTMVELPLELAPPSSNVPPPPALPAVALPAATLATPAATAAPVREPPADREGPGTLRAAAIATTIGATAQAVFGVAAFAAAGQAHDDAVRDCSAVRSTSADACDGPIARVRTWDWLAAGAWAGAAIGAGAAVVLWTRAARHARAPAAAPAAPAQPEARWVIGPGSIAVAGSF